MRIFAVVCLLGLAAMWIGSAANGTLPWVWAALLAIAPAPLLWWGLFRPKLVLGHEDVTVVSLFRTRRYPLADFMDARPGYAGTWFELPDGSGFWAGTLQRPNYAAWFQLTTRAHRAADEVLAAAATQREEAPSVAIERGPG